MKNITLFVAFILVVFGTQLNAQNILRVHNSNNLIYQQQVDNIDSLKFGNNNSDFYPTTGVFSLPVAGMDSITFANTFDGEIYIIYNGSQATIINPFSAQGVTITDSLGHVTATSTYPNPNLKYNILGTTANGSLKLTSTESVRLIMCHATITNPVGAAISITNSSAESEIFLSSGTVNTLNDGSASTENGALYSKKNLIITGTGALNLNSVVKHGIKVDAALTIESGIINVSQAASDGFNTKEYTQNGGTITITPYPPV